MDSDHPICPDRTPLTEWPAITDFTLLCVNVPVGGKTCWCKAIYLRVGEGPAMLSVVPTVDWVGSGDPSDWHVHNR